MWSRIIFLWDYFWWKGAWLQREIFHFNCKLQYTLWVIIFWSCSLSLSYFAPLCKLYCFIIYLRIGLDPVILHTLSTISNFSALAVSFYMWLQLSKLTFPVSLPPSWLGITVRAETQILIEYLRCLAVGSLSQELKKHWVLNLDHLTYISKGSSLQLTTHGLAFFMDQAPSGSLSRSGKMLRSCKLLYNR